MAMKPSEAIRLKRQDVHDAAIRFHVANSRVFGSALSGTDTGGSDLNILVDALPGATLFDLGGLQEALQDLLGVRVDLRTPGDLPPPQRERILKEAKPIGIGRLPTILTECASTPGMPWPSPRGSGGTIFVLIAEHTKPCCRVC